MYVVILMFLWIQTQCKSTKSIEISIVDFSKQINICNQRLDNNNAANVCAELIGNNWNCLNFIQSKSLNKDPHQRIHLMCGSDSDGPLFCCPIWAMIRCIFQYVKDNCTDLGGQQFFQQYWTENFHQQVEQLNRERCFNYTFASVECSNVLVYIQNNQLLERVGRFNKYKFPILNNSNYYFSKKI